jgi:methionyl-tRNA formyltransferase
MKIVQELDAGDIIAVKELDIDENLNFGMLHDMLCNIAKPLLLDVIKQYENGNVKKCPQEDSLATFAPKITAQVQELKFNLSATEVHNLIRGLSPFPGARCSMVINNQEKKVKILESEVMPLRGSPGEVLKCEKGQFIIGCGKDSISIKKLQIEGKKPVSAAEFISGIKNPVKII